MSAPVLDGVPVEVHVAHLLGLADDALVTALLPGLPFGGVRSSGFGRLHGDAGIREFSVPKAVATSRLPGIPGLTASMFGSVRPSAGQVATVMRLLWGRRG